ncbi:hypothetical protein N7453_006381 [Penicillium expansum]|nr:hypothetical protein N7453_006381 [Penicillium expansum]
MKDSKSQSLSPALLEERDYPNSYSQVGTLTEAQQELIDSIGNKQLASRLHKHTLKIFTREERLEAIEFYRTHVHINPQTGEERNVSIASASEALHVSESTLERWVNEETKITSMRYGNARDDGERYASAPASKRFKSGNYPFLRLTPEQLSAKKYVQGKDFYKLESAIPVRIGFDYDEPFQGAPTHWAIKLLLNTKAEFLLPLSLCLRGSIKHEVVPDTLLLQGWTMDYEMLKCKTRKRQRIEERENAIRYSQEFYRKSQPIFEKFRLSPVLYIEDVEMLFLGSQSWRPRRFSPTWTLYSTILHSSYRSGDTLTPIYGKYTDIKSFVDSIVTRAPQVSFSAPAVRDFQLVSLDHFYLVPQVSENTVLSQFSKHLEVSDTRPGRGLRLESIEETLRQDAHTTREREFREKLVHALKLSVQKSLKHINGEKRCLYYTCPEPQVVPISYYCHHHSESLINYVMNPVEPINLPAYREQEREINITDQTRVILQQLKVLYGRPEKTWILDFEYISMPKRYSPIPLQLAIRQLDGKLLYQGNIDYGLSMKEFMYTTSPYVSDKHGMMGTLFLRCYGGLNTNGETSLRVRDQIIKVCGYNRDDIKILSWFAAQDMQCFLKILTGSNELIQEKIPHQGHENFQTINIGTLCGKLFPGLISTTLQSVHEFLSGGKGSRGEYHTASYDTEAMATIIKALVQLG